MKKIYTLVALVFAAQAYAQPVLLKDIYPGTSSGARSLLNAKIYNNKLYFSATDVNDNVELWSSDGTATGTTQVANINSTSSSYPGNFTIFNNQLFFPHIP